MYIKDMTYKDKMERKTKYIRTFRVSEKTHKRLAELALRSGHSITSVVRNILEKHS